MAAESHGFVFGFPWGLYLCLIFQFPIYLEPSSQLPIYQVTRPPGSKYIGNWKNEGLITPFATGFSGPSDRQVPRLSHHLAIPRRSTIFRVEGGDGTDGAAVTQP